jgi:hypothetical protein
MDESELLARAIDEIATLAKAPLFLRKTYVMVNALRDLSLASWSEDGLTFVVRDTERFASEIIPQYFKHKN